MPVRTQTEHGPGTAGLGHVMGLMHRYFYAQEQNQRNDAFIVQDSGVNANTNAGQGSVRTRSAAA